MVHLLILKNDPVYAALGTRVHERASLGGVSDDWRGIGRWDTLQGEWHVFERRLGYREPAQTSCVWGDIETVDSSSAGSGPGRKALIIVCGQRRYALPLGDVEEIMRPLPAEPLPEAPGVVDGLSVIRGRPVPVIDLARVCGESAPGPVTRYVLLRCGKRRFALAVEAVTSVLTLSEATLAALPTLLDGADRLGIEAVAVVDGQLLTVLESARLLPAGAWG